MQLPDKYDIKQEEKKWQDFWEKEGVYRFDPNDSKKKIYSVDTPPPTVSGRMHIGHAFSYSQQDFVVRYHRMTGKNVFYPFGTDDNGLPTERLVEKERKVKGSRMDRQEFIKLCISFLEEERPRFIQDWKDIGTSCDWSIYYSTIDDHSRRISQRSFIDLYKKGREYRKKAPSIWCPTCQTAISQVELEDKEISSQFNDIVFKLEDGKELVIATTRPELLPACVAVFAHPEDKRYQHLFGKFALTPVFEQKVPILPDERADPEKGTGAVMCCTFGDQTDIEWYKAHRLPLKIAITKDGLMTSIAGKYVGLPLKEARKAIIEDMKQKGLLKSQKDISHMVNVHERCSTEVEILETEQWFIQYLDLKDFFAEAGNRLAWFPHHMKNRYDNWVKGLQWDWCISRQRFFGVPFPVWYCKKCGAVTLAEEEQLPVDPLKDKPRNKCKCGSDDFEPEKDVLDTWATSALTPIIATELMKDKPVYKKLFPMNLRPQAHDIITFWLFNTVVKSQLQFKKNPWKDVMIAGWALDPHGKKMSKSKGNIVDPRIVLEKYGADALRFWAAGSKLGEDMPYQEKDLFTGQKMVTKLFNSSKFAVMHLEDYDLKKPKNLQPMDRWLLSKLNRLIKDSTESFEKYEYSRTKSDTEKFFWQTLCDNYLEIAKDRLYNPDKRGKEERKAAQYALYESSLSVLKLMAPIMPYITESVYQMYFAEKEGIKSIHISSWPKVNEKLIDAEAEEAGDVAVDVISAVRRFKSENKISLKEQLKKITIQCEEKHKKMLESVMDDVKATVKCDDIVFGDSVSISCDSFKVKLGIDR